MWLKEEFQRRAGESLGEFKERLKAAESTAVRWPDPGDLGALIAYEPYPLDALPRSIGDAVYEVQQFIKAPVPLVASSALAAISLVIQGHVNVKRAAKLVGPASLFSLNIASSGERKTTCDGFFATPIREYEQAQAKAAEPELRDYKAKLDAWSARRDGLLAAIKQAAKTGKATQEFRVELLELERIKPKPPRVPIFLRGDETPENLAWALAKEWPSAGILCSEGGAILGAHAMGRDSIMRNLALLNILWDGGLLRIGRRSSESFCVQHARLTVGCKSKKRRYAVSLIALMD